MSLESDERYTPRHVLEVVRRVSATGEIAYDPCCGPLAPMTARICSQTSGLQDDWYNTCGKGLVYVNPPYSRGQLLKWSIKIHSEACMGCEIVALTPCDLGTKWAEVLFDQADGIAFWKGRIGFGSPEKPGGIGAGAKQPSAFWYFGDRYKAFKRAFANVARVVVLR